MLVHDEPVLLDGRIVGRMTSGSYGHTLGRATLVPVYEVAS